MRLLGIDVVSMVGLSNARMRRPTSVQSAYLKPSSFCTIFVLWLLAASISLCATLTYLAGQILQCSRTVSIDFRMLSLAASQDAIPKPEYAPSERRSEASQDYQAQSTSISRIAIKSVTLSDFLEMKRSAPLCISLPSR